MSRPGERGLVEMIDEDLLVAAAAPRSRRHTAGRRRRRRRARAGTALVSVARAAGSVIALARAGSRGNRQAGVVHRAVLEILADRDRADTTIVNRCGLAIGRDRRREPGVHARPVGRQVQRLVARHDLVAHGRIEVHAVLVDQRLDRGVVALPP